MVNNFCAIFLGCLSLAQSIKLIPVRSNRPTDFHSVKKSLGRASELRVRLTELVKDFSISDSNRHQVSALLRAHKLIENSLKVFDAEVTKSHKIMTCPEGGDDCIAISLEYCHRIRKAIELETSYYLSYMDQIISKGWESVSEPAVNPVDIIGLSSFLSKEEVRQLFLHWFQVGLNQSKLTEEVETIKNVGKKKSNKSWGIVITFLVGMLFYGKNFFSRKLKSCSKILRRFISKYELIFSGMKVSILKSNRKVVVKPTGNFLKKKKIITKPTPAASVDIVHKATTEVLQQEQEKPSLQISPPVTSSVLPSSVFQEYRPDNEEEWLRKISTLSDEEWKGNSDEGWVTLLGTTSGRGRRKKTAIPSPPPNSSKKYRNDFSISSISSCTTTTPPSTTISTTPSTTITSTTSTVTTLPSATSLPTLERSLSDRGSLDESNQTDCDSGSDSGTTFTEKLPLLGDIIISSDGSKLTEGENLVASPSFNLPVPLLQSPPTISPDNGNYYYNQPDYPYPTSTSPTHGLMYTPYYNNELSTSQPLLHGDMMAGYYYPTPPVPGIMNPGYHEQQQHLQSLHLSQYTYHNNNNNNNSLIQVVRSQMEYYFSVDNLCKDLYLRSKMDGDGFVLLREILQFNRMKIINAPLYLILEAVQSSSLIEVCLPWAAKVSTEPLFDEVILNTKLRCANNWQQWVMTIQK